MKNMKYMKKRTCLWFEWQRTQECRQPHHWEVLDQTEHIGLYIGYPILLSDSLLEKVFVIVVSERLLSY